MTVLPDDSAQSRQVQSSNPDKPQEAGYVKPRRLRWVLTAAGLTCLATASAGVWFVLRDDPVARLPQIELSGADSLVTRTIQSGRDRVVQKPYSGQAWGRLGMLLLAHGYHSDAEACLSEAERLEPTEFRWPYFGGLSRSGDDPLAAAECFQRVIELRPGLLLARFRLAELLIDLGRLDDAEREVRLALEVEPENARAGCLMARLALHRGHLSDSRHWAEKCVAAAPQDAHARELLAQIAHRSGESRLAAEQRDMAERLAHSGTDWGDPFLDELTAMRRDPDQLSREAHQLLRDGRPVEAIAILDQLVVQHPDNALFYIELAMVLEAAGNDRRAVNVVETAIRKFPNAAEPHRVRGLLYHRRGNWAEAARCYREAIQRKASHSLAYFGLGMCLLQMQEEEEALVALRNAVRFRPDLADAHEEIGKLLLRQGRSAEAVGHLRAARHGGSADPSTQRRLEDLIRQIESEDDQ